MQALSVGQRKQYIDVVAKGPAVPPNPYQKVINIFGVDDILLLVAGDGAGGLMDYVPTPWSFTDTTEITDIAPITNKFSTPGVHIGPLGTRNYTLPDHAKTFSLGVFHNSAETNTTPISLSGAGFSMYLSIVGRIMIRNDIEGVNYYSPTGFATYGAPEFIVFSADESAQEMYLQASGGTHTISDYPSTTGGSHFRFPHQSDAGGREFDAQFFILLNRLMTDTEIAQVRALL